MHVSRPRAQFANNSAVFSFPYSESMLVWGLKETYKCTSMY